MNYPYATLYFDTRQAKQRLTRFFQSGPERKPTVCFNESPEAPVASDQREDADRPEQSKENVASLEAGADIGRCSWKHSAAERSTERLD
jgi:hypothetical protein